MARADSRDGPKGPSHRKDPSINSQFQAQRLYTSKSKIIPKNTSKSQLNKVQSTPLLESLIQLTNAERELIAGGPINIVRNGGAGHGGTSRPK